jgi:hypothetical protein
MITRGKGKYKVWLKKEKLGDDLVYILGGGEKAHVGSVIVKEPGRKSQAIRLEGHYDNVVLEPIVEEASRKYGKTIVALGGVHVNDASKAEIELLVSNCRELVKCI